MPVTVEIRRASQGYLTRERGLRTRHAFSFGGHYDPENTSFGAMVCHDDHLVGSGLGFPDHPHAGVEIVTWVLEGALVHTDSTGSTHVVEAGRAQVLSAGSGIRHSEVADASSGPCRFIQAWITPTAPGTEPSYVLGEAPPSTSDVPTIVEEKSAIALASLFGPPSVPRSISDPPLCRNACLAPRLHLPQRRHDAAWRDLRRHRQRCHRHQRRR